MHAGIFLFCIKAKIKNIIYEIDHKKGGTMSNRIERANSEVQRCIAQIITTKMNDPRLSPFLYVSEISLTPDFKYCKVKIALDNDDQNVINQNLQVLQKSEGFIKRELAKMVDMPFMPKLSFVLDKGTSASVRVNELLKNLNIPKLEEDEDNGEIDE